MHRRSFFACFEGETRAGNSLCKCADVCLLSSLFDRQGEVLRWRYSVKPRRSESAAVVGAVILGTVIGGVIGFAVALEMDEARRADGAGGISPEDALKRIVFRWRARMAAPTAAKTSSPPAAPATHPVPPAPSNPSAENGSTCRPHSRACDEGGDCARCDDDEDL